MNDPSRLISSRWDERHVGCPEGQKSKRTMMYTNGVTQAPDHRAGCVNVCVWDIKHRRKACVHTDASPHSLEVVGDVLMAIRKWSLWSAKFCDERVWDRKGRWNSLTWRCLELWEQWRGNYVLRSERVTWFFDELNWKQRFSSQGGEEDGLIAHVFYLEPRTRSCIFNTTVARNHDAVAGTDIFA